MLIWKTLCLAQKRFERLDAPGGLIDLYEGRRFVDGNWSRRPAPEAVYTFMKDLIMIPPGE